MEEAHVPPRPPLGKQIHLALVHNGTTAAASLARPASRICSTGSAQSPAKTRPQLPALRALRDVAARPPASRRARTHHPPGWAIHPGDQSEAGRRRPWMASTALRSLGVPYGSLPRLVLIHIMTEAVRTRSRHIRLGQTFTDWMRRMGFRTISYGPRGSATLIKEQLDRLLACEWMIRWDSATDAGRARVRHQGDQAHQRVCRGRPPQRRLSCARSMMTEGFSSISAQHAVPLNEAAIRQIRDSATALDLYTWLAYRLPRLNPKRPATLSWQQLAVHFGNDGRQHPQVPPDSAGRLGAAGLRRLSGSTGGFRHDGHPAPLLPCSPAAEAGSRALVSRW